VATASAVASPAAAAAWGRGGMPPHSTRRPNPPCPAGRPAVRRASESLPARAGLGQPRYGPPWPSNTGQSYLPPPSPTGRERQAPAGARLGARGTRTAAGLAPGSIDGRRLAPIRRFGRAGRVLVPLGVRVQPPTLRAGRPPKGGHVSPTFSTRSGHYPPTVY
jgi:hypothetical protein